MVSSGKFVFAMCIFWDWESINHSPHEFPFQQAPRLVSVILVILSAIALVVAQRSPYAGSRPSGYHDRFRPTAASAAVDNGIGNRFGGENSASANLVAGRPTQRIPIDALKDREIYEVLSRYPVDKQPFWLINYQTIEAHRQPIRGWLTVNQKLCGAPLGVYNKLQVIIF